MQAVPHRYSVIAALLLVLALGSSPCGSGIRMVLAQDAGNSAGGDSSAPPVATSEQQQRQANPTEDTFNVQQHMDWGSYYDPKNIFCGKYDCYRILGFDYESYGKEKPDTKLITKRYRALSREWHPDKSKHKDAKERFVVS
jgi:DnaJ family protein C protein 25